MDLELCRICNKNGGSIDIFQNNADVSHGSKLMYCCAKVIVAEGDGLSSHICPGCEAELSFCYQFVLKCEYTNTVLKSTEIKTKQEDTKWDLILKQESDDHSIGDLNFDDQSIKNEDYDYTQASSTKGPSTCSECGRTFARSSSLTAHMRTHSNKKPFACSLCDKKYKDAGGLNRHLQRSHEKEKRNRDFICEQCGKGFYSKTDVKIHMRTHTGETPYPCTMCPKKFSQISTLLRHKRRHTGEKTHICATCSKRFCTKEELKNHERVHTKEKMFICPLCNGDFKYKSNLMKHIRMHSEQNSFICNHCGRTFNIKGNLQVHIDRVHSEKSGFCKQCCKSVSNIETHMWRHTGQRPLKCELCASSFYELKALTHHINFRHKNAQKYKCMMDGCNMKFPTQPMLSFHFAKLHSSEIPFPCDKCSRGFYRKNDLARHKIGTHKERL